MNWYKLPKTRNDDREKPNNIIFQTSFMLLWWGVVMIVPQLLIGQPIERFGTQQVISESTYGALDVFSKDLDGDGDQDILSVSFSDGNVFWHENQGDGNFSGMKLIGSNEDRPYDVYATDLIGNGRNDVLVASEGSDEVAWYRNLGDGNFSSRNVLPSSVAGVHSVHAADFDGDDDMDVLTSTEDLAKIYWFKNSGNGNFEMAREISPNAIVDNVYAADLDGDNDPDVIGGHDDEVIGWWENTGNGNFSSRKLVTTDATTDIYAADMDGDGDVDIISGSSHLGQIAWYENLDSGGFSSSANIVSDEAVGVYNVYAKDLDGDGDQDVLSASNDDDNIAWYENEGDGSFEGQKIISNSVDAPYSVHAADLTGDGDAEVLSASFTDDKIAWYDNQSELFDRVYLWSKSYSTAEDHEVRISVADEFIVPYPDVTSYNVLDSVENGMVDITNDTIRYNPAENFYGKDSLRFAAADTTGNDTATVYFFIEAVNDAPTVVNDTLTISKNTNTIIKALENDSDVESDSIWISYASDGNHGKGGASWNDQHIIYEPADGYTGSDRLEYYVTDEHEAWAKGMVVINIVESTEENQAPEVVLQPEISVLEDSTLTLALTKMVADDRDAISELSFDVSESGQTGLSVHKEDEALLLSPSANWWGTQQVHLTVTDNEGLTTSDSTTITVIKTNDPPQAEAAIAEENMVDNGYEVRFADKSSDPLDPEGKVTRWHWKFGDGTTSTDPEPVHTYKKEGIYTVKLAVADDAGATDTTRIDVEVTTTGIEAGNVPEKFALKENYPNPFNPTTQIQYDVAEASQVELEVYNSAGKRVSTLVNSRKSAGSYSVNFDAANLPSGIYIYRLQAGDFIETRKMTLIK